MIYDTGASGVIGFEGPARALSLPVAQFGGADVVLTDVGVGGSTIFGVSAPRDDVLTQLATVRFAEGELPGVADVMRIAATLFAAGVDIPMESIVMAMNGVAKPSRGP